MRPDQVQRYARHILLPDVGGLGQKRLLSARVRIDDASGAGAIAVHYLAAAGVGTLCIDDEGVVGPGDGPLYETSDLGRPRRDAVRDRVAELNPDVTVVACHDGRAHALPHLGTAASPTGALASGAAAAESIIRDILS